MGQINTSNRWHKRFFPILTKITSLFQYPKLPIEQRIQQLATQILEEF